MIRRCYNERDQRFSEYGARGITVCEEWRASFQAFIDHIGMRPTDRHSIDRIKNDQGYFPGNVRWATDSEQNNNRRSNIIASIGGVNMTAAQIARKFGLSHRVVIYRIGRGMSEERITAPSRRPKLPEAQRANAIEAVLAEFNE